MKQTKKQTKSKAPESSTRSVKSAKRHSSKGSRAAPDLGARQPPQVSRTGPPANDDAIAAKRSGTQALASAVPFNENKSSEYGADAALAPPGGISIQANDRAVTGSTLTETNESPKTGMPAAAGENPASGPLTRVRVDSGGQELTTNQGVAIGDNQHSLKAGLRGPALLEDFILREKLTHFDHERIPERVVHARGSGAHGYFECYESLADVTRASLFSEAGKRSPAFVRFSTVAGERGSADTVRDARGFAVKIYTDEGNWDLVGNNIPVFFIQDAIKFPDLVHAIKPEPHFAMPQASTAHDTFWDFASLTPESAHMLLWVMSDRAIPRSYRMMQGFGVHTFRFVNVQGEARFVKFHWNPVAGTHSLVWDEAVKICGADADFHRRDLWEAIEAGAYPEWELGAQIFTEEEAERMSFDVLDATKLVPEELVPVRPIGKLVLDRNPDNFFAETEQVAFCTAHVVPGIDFSNDPLLAGRVHSYVDTQITRLGGPNFHEIPINAPVAPVHNNQRDGMHRQSLHRGRVSYEPNSLGGGSPFQAGPAGFTSFPERLQGDKVRGHADRFAEHYRQATLFWKSQSAVERNHIVAAFRFELTRVETPAVRERVVALLANVADELAERVASGLGIAVPSALPNDLPGGIRAAEVESSPALSLLARPGDGSVRTRRVAILVADGVESEALVALHGGLRERGAIPRFVGSTLGNVNARSGGAVQAEATFETAPGVLFDAVVIADGAEAIGRLVNDARALEFVKEQYRHCKPVLAIGKGRRLIEAAGVPTGEASHAHAADPGLLLLAPAAGPERILGQLVEAMVAHRHFERETDPPRV